MADQNSDAATRSRSLIPSGGWSTGLALAGLLMLSLMLYRLSSMATRGGDGAPLYSTRRFDPYGTAGLSALLREIGHPVRVLNRRSLPPAGSFVLLQARPGSSDKEHDPTEARIPTKSLLAWVDQGNTWVYASRSLDDSMLGLGLTEPHGNWTKPKVLEAEKRGLSPDVLRQATVEARVIDSRFQTSEPISLVDPAIFEPKEDSGWSPLAKTEEGVVAYSKKHGAGEIIFIGAPTPLLNHGLAEGGNLDFLLKLVKDREVLIDDYSLGFQQSGTLMGIVRDLGLLPFVFQMLLCVGLFWWSGRGESRSVCFREVPRRSSSEQIQTLGYLYQESLTSKMTWSLVVEEIRRRLACHENISRRLRVGCSIQAVHPYE